MRTANRVAFGLRSACRMGAAGRFKIADQIALLICTLMSPAVASAETPWKKATYLWQGTVHAQSSYASQEYDGTPGKHAWTRDYRIVLAEIPTTSSNAVLVGGNWVSWPINHLIPMLVEYRIEAFTDDRPYHRGPAHGGHVATGSASGTLTEGQLAKIVSTDLVRIGGTWGEMNRLVAPEAPPATPSTWTRTSDYVESMGKVLTAPGGYDVGISLRGSDASAAQTKALYDGITVTYLPCGIPGIDVPDQARLESPEGFLDCMQILEMVHIFGVLERPDQKQVSGSHFFLQYDPSPEHSPPQILVTWDLKRIPFQPFVKVEYRQVQDYSFIGPLAWFPHNEFGDFLVGHKQKPIDVRIRTIPEDSAIQWELAPEGARSGSIDPSQGTSKDFSFTPDAPPAHVSQGSRVPNAPKKYTLVVRDEDGSRQLLRETISQDTISIMRQEYVDYRRHIFLDERRGWRDVRYGLVPPPRERFGPIEPIGGNFTLPADRTDLYGNYFRPQTTLNGGWREMALNTQQEYNSVIDLNSGYRNPQRNTAVNGAATSIHMMGGAVDMDMEPQTEPDMVALHRAALRRSGGSEILLEIAGGGVAGGTLLVPRNWGPPAATHTFVIANGSITVEDSDNDDLPDRVSDIAGAPRNGIASATLLPFAGGGQTNPAFQIQDTNRNSRIDVGEPLLLRYPVTGDPPTVALHPLRYYYETATHVHCATGGLPREQGP